MYVRKKRADGVWVKNLSPTRAIVPFLMQKKAESTVYFDQRIVVDQTLLFLKKLEEQTGRKVRLFHLILYFVGQALHLRPRLNRFVSGYRIYQRNGIYLSFSAKKEKSDSGELYVVKRKFDPSLSFFEFVESVERGIQEGKGKEPRSIDKEVAFFLKLPWFLLYPLVKLVFLLDWFGLLPNFFIKDDPFFSSIFIANLGSIGMKPGYHHLYEYGNIPLFMVIGEIEEELYRDPNGNIATRKVLPIRYTFDERIEDGLYCLGSLNLFRDWLSNPSSVLTTEGKFSPSSVSSENP
jgi:hypothetical protein